MLFTLVVVGRLQEVVSLLASLKVVFMTGGLAASAWLLAPGTIGDKVPSKLRPVRYVLTLLVLAVGTIPFGAWPGHSFQFLVNSYWKLVLLFLMVLYFCRSISDLRRVIWMICLGPIALVAHGVLVGIESGSRFDAGSSTYDPNDLAP